MLNKHNIPIKIFQQHTHEAFGSLFPQKLISTLSNMLAIDFSLRENDVGCPLPEMRAETCVKNIQAYLSIADQQFDDSFGSATILFSVAISPPQNINYIDSVGQLQNKEEVVDAYIASHMVDLSKEELESMRDALSLLLESVDAHSILNFIAEDPKVLSAINAKYTAQMRKVRAQLIANEVIETHAAKRRSLDVSLSSALTMQSLIQDLAKHASAEEYKKPKVAVAPKGISPLQRQ